MVLKSIVSDRYLGTLEMFVEVPGNKASNDYSLSSLD